MEKVYGIWAIHTAASIFGYAEAWCKSNDKPIEFDTLEAAQSYADEMNKRTTANVHYSVREKAPESKAEFIQPDIGALSHAENIPWNEASEKNSEITGRQVVPEPDNFVEIRSAVHSNYANMVAMIAADNKVYLGKEENYHFKGAQPGVYDNSDNSLCFISDRQDMYYFLYGEGWAHSQKDMLERGLTMEQYMEFARLRDSVLQQFTPRREILFSGQTFQPPENYLRNTELDLEGENGNYNMIDGIVNNAPPARADLTDGQTFEELKELAPETLPSEKPSIMERLRAERQEKEAHSISPAPPERGL